MWSYEAACVSPSLAGIAVTMDSLKYALANSQQLRLHKDQAVFIRLHSLHWYTGGTFETFIMRCQASF